MNSLIVKLRANSESELDILTLWKEIIQSLAD